MIVFIEPDEDYLQEPEATQKLKGNSTFKNDEIDLDGIEFKPTEVKKKKPHKTVITKHERTKRKSRSELF